MLSGGHDRFRVNAPFTLFTKSASIGANWVREAAAGIEFTARDAQICCTEMGL
jgi:hypothetical protein